LTKSISFDISSTRKLPRYQIHRVQQLIFQTTAEVRASFFFEQSATEGVSLVCFLIHSNSWLRSNEIKFNFLFILAIFAFTRSYKSCPGLVIERENYAKTHYSVPWIYPIFTVVSFLQLTVIKTSALAWAVNAQLITCRWMMWLKSQISFKQLRCEC